MSQYELYFQPSVEKDLRRLSQEVFERVMIRLEALCSEPFPPQSTKLAATEGLYRIRVGDYRIIYEVDTTAKKITIYYVRHRREVYRNFYHPSHFPVSLTPSSSTQNSELKTFNSSLPLPPL